jgi:hypothetical protein
MSLHSGLEHLRDAARTPLTIEECPAVEDGVCCSIPLRLYDGDPSVYRLQISIGSEDGQARLVVREQSAHRRLPLGCPARHINMDGTFCVGWGPSRPPVPRNATEAETAWKIICGYLQLQDRATASGEWPPEAAWAHGDAAKAQQAIEDLASTLPARLAKPSQLELLRLTRRRPCPCGSGDRVKDCHEPSITELRSLYAAVVRGEDAFWRGWAGRPCCGTMRECRLREQ